MGCYIDSRNGSNLFSLSVNELPWSCVFNSTDADPAGSAISPDDTIDSMRRIGNELPVCLKETGMGGLAVTESAKKIMKKMLNVTEMLKID